MSEYIDNSTKRKELLKHLLLQLHEGAPAEVLRGRLIEVLSGIPYNEVVEVEQELINAGALTPDEILDFCDLHTAVLDGSIDLEGAKTVPAGHPVDTLKKENIAIQDEIDNLYNANLNESVQGVNLDLDYLMNASYISEDRKLETQRDLYQQMKSIAQDMRKGDLSESYEFNKAREKLEEMQKRDGQDNFGYLKRIRNMLGDLDDYISGNR